MSQSWDNVASMHDHLLTVHAHKTWRRSSCTNSILPGQGCPLVPCACADGSGCRGHTPNSKQLQLLVCNGDVLTLLEHCYWTADGYDIEQTSPLALLEAQWLAPFERAALLRQSFDNVSLAVAIT